MKKIFAIALLLILTVGMFTACGKIEDDVSSVANNDISKSEKADSIASQGSNDNLLTENNQTAENLYYVVTKAADDLSKGQFDGITASKDIAFGEYRITYVVKNQNCLTRYVSCKAITNGELVVRIIKRNVKSTDSNKENHVLYSVKVFYSDSQQSLYTGNSSINNLSKEDFYKISHIPEFVNEYECDINEGQLTGYPIAIHTNISTLDTGVKIEIRGGKNAQYRG